MSARRTITLIDWLLCALLAVGALTLGWYALRTRGTDAHTTPIVYTVRITAADATLFSTDAAPIAQGDAVFSENGTAPLGTVASVRIAPHKRAVVRDGQLIFSEMPDRMDIDVTVRASAMQTEGLGLRVSDVRIAAGEVGSFRIGSYYAAQAIVVHVTYRGTSNAA